MTRTFEIVTPEQVAIQYELAGIGSRGIAALVDAGVQILLVLLLLAFGWILQLVNILPGMDRLLDRLTENVIAAIIILGMFLISWGYFIIFETLWNGETPGKRMMGLRVIKDGGYPVDFRAVLIRNLLRAADALPLLPEIPVYCFGVIAVMAHGQSKRLGDMAAGTLVVRHGQREENQRKAELGNPCTLR